jgi:hypothetical protein
MKNAPGVNAARALYNRKNQSKTECDCSGAQPVTNFAASFGLSGLFAAGLNPTQQFVGSYRVDIYPVKDVRRNSYSQIHLVLNHLLMELDQIGKVE